jgi:hypothetical protein
MDPKLGAAVPDELNRNELPLIFPSLQVLYHEERQVRDRGVVEFAGRKAVPEMRDGSSALLFSGTL